jgi:hypothetical protein
LRGKKLLSKAIYEKPISRRMAQLTNNIKYTIQKWQVPVDVEYDCQQVYFSFPDKLNLARKCKKVVIGLEGEVSEIKQR